MNQTDCSPESYSPLHRITTVIVLFQAVFLFAQLFNEDQNSNPMVAILAATVAISAVNRRFFASSQGRQAAFYVSMWRYGVLALLGALSVLVALRAYAPDVMPDKMPTLVAMLVSSVIALKGAALGKLKPGGVLGLRLPWTCRSRLAWEKAHRLLGRILFSGGLIVLAASPFVPFAAALAAIAIVVVAGVTTAAIESWRVWRNDPERLNPG